MTKLWVSSDLHLGHKNVLRFRDEFSSQQEHNETIFENLATAVNKRDSLYLLGDVAFDYYWLNRLKEIRCAKKTLILGNHDTDQRVDIRKLANVFNSIHSLHSRRNTWFSHCPIHESQFRGKTLNIHGHVHTKTLPDKRYFNACVDVNDYKPVTFEQIINN
jgi:calcineurin-like phosphoesterase family protein